MSGAIEAQALEHLKNFPNPFEEVVRPQLADDSFPNVDVPSVFYEQRHKLFAAVDAFRVEDYSSPTDLTPTRALTVLGARGAGKTHLLEALLHRKDASQLIIRRESEDFDESTVFEEYMHQQFLRALLTRQAKFDARPIDRIASQLGRLILSHALRELGPTDRLFAAVPSKWQRFRLLSSGGGERIGGRYERLARDLEDPHSSSQLAKFIVKHGFHPQQLCELALARIDRHENEETTKSVIRREFYRAIIRASLLEERSAFADFLEADYRPKDARVIYRTDVVRQILNVLVEACALVQLPVVFAFDNLEGLLAPQGKLNKARAAAFFDGLAQAIDHTRGFLFLIFAEEELFNQAKREAGTFAASRIGLRVQTQSRASIGDLFLPSPTAAELEDLIENRLRPRWENYPHKDQLAPTFPFTSDFLAEVHKRHGTPIRLKLQELQHEYDRVVHQVLTAQPTTPAVATGTNIEQEQTLLVKRLWEEKLSAATLALESSLATQVADLTQGLGLILEAAMPFSVAKGKVQAVSPQVRIGDDHRYGFVTIVSCLPEASNESAKPHRLAIGLFLATGKGMPLDLQAKLQAFSDDNCNADSLIILWLTDKQGPELSAFFTGKTAEVWKKCSNKHQIAVRSIRVEDLRKLRAFPNWKIELQNQDGEIDPELFRRFVHDKCKSVIDLIQS